MLAAGGLTAWHSGGDEPWTCPCTVSGKTLQRPVQGGYLLQSEVGHGEPLSEEQAQASVLVCITGLTLTSGESQACSPLFYGGGCKKPANFSLLRESGQKASGSPKFT